MLIHSALYIFLISHLVNHFFSNILTMDIIDSDDSDLEMAFMEAVVIPSFRKQRKQPVPRQVNALGVGNLLFVKRTQCQTRFYSSMCREGQNICLPTQRYESRNQYNEIGFD